MVRRAASPRSSRRLSGASRGLPVVRVAAPLLVLLSLSLSLALLGGAVAAQEAEPPPAPARVVIVGDSIIEGAEGALRAAFGDAGWEVAFDAETSRPTSTGAAILRDLVAQPTTAAVVMLGANDGASPAIFSERVQAVLEATSGVSRLYWLTIPEVRDYYPAANAVLEQAAATRPGMTLLQWDDAIALDPSLARSDGLHLSGGGGEVMAFLVASHVLNDAWLDFAARVTTTTVPPPTTALEQGGPSASPAGGAPDPAPPPAEVAGATVTAVQATEQAPADPPQAAAPDPGDGGRGLTGSIASAVASVGLVVALALAVLAAAGTVLAAWSLRRSGPSPKLE